MALNLTPNTIFSGLEQVGNFLNQITKTDTVQVLNQETMQQAFKGARPLRAVVKETAKVMDYPVETGSVLSDHRVSNPTEIEMECLIVSGQYSIAYPDIRNAWQNATLLSVQTRLGTYRNMIISDLPHEENSEIFSAVTLLIKFREVILVAPSSIAAQSQLANYQPADPENNTVINSGLIAAVNAPASILSYFSPKTVWGGLL